VIDPSEPDSIMAWPNPADPGEVEWRLRYGTPTREDLLWAASTIAAYRHLVDMPQRMRNRRVGQIREAGR
jgi:hypothetical protein